jgi:4-carboxymuconolactone decarboxylase
MYERGETVKPIDLLRRECPDVFKAFEEMASVILKKPKLDYKTKQLIYVGICSAIRDTGGVRYHSGEALKTGASKDEIVEAVLLALPTAGISAVLTSLPVALEAVEIAR